MVLVGSGATTALPYFVSDIDVAELCSFVVTFLESNSITIYLLSSPNRWCFYYDIPVVIAQ